MDILTKQNIQLLANSNFTCIATCVMYNQTTYVFETTAEASTAYVKFGIPGIISGWFYGKQDFLQELHKNDQCVHTEPVDITWIDYETRKVNRKNN